MGWVTGLWSSTRSNSAAPKPEIPAGINDVRVVLVGKPGVGKSATGNALLGEERFEVGTVTRSCQLGIREWEGRRLVLIDTPANFDLGSSTAKDSPDTQHCLRLARPGPHVLLLVVTDHCNDADYKAIDWVQETFGREAMKYTIVVLTGGEMDRAAWKEHLSHSKYQRLQNMVGHGNFQWFSADNPNQDERKRQAEDLLSLVKNMLQQNQEKPFCSPEMVGTSIPKDVSVVPAEEGKPQEAMATPEIEGSSVEGRESPPVQNAAAPVSAEQEENELRIAIVGKSGVGKSATGNTILGAKRFDSRLKITPVTKSCQLGIREWKGKRVIVIDTPAILDSDGAPNSMEMEHCQHLLQPHPHALVLVVPVGRFTEEDHRVAQQVKKTLDTGDQKCMVVVFSHKERLQNESLEDYISSGDNKNLLELKDQCGGRFCSFNNNETGDNLASQAERLLSMIEQMAEKNQGQPGMTSDEVAETNT